MLMPALAVLVAVTLAPTVFLLATSLTPLDLTQPETIGDFSQPLRNYRAAARGPTLSQQPLGAGQAVVLDRAACSS